MKDLYTDSVVTWPALLHKYRLNQQELSALCTAACLADVVGYPCSVCAVSCFSHAMNHGMSWPLSWCSHPVNKPWAVSHSCCCSREGLVTGFTEPSFSGCKRSRPVLWNAAGWAPSIFIRVEKTESCVSQHALGHRVKHGSAAVFERVDLWLNKSVWFIYLHSCLQTLLLKPLIIELWAQIICLGKSFVFEILIRRLSRICRDLLKLYTSGFWGSFLCSLSHFISLMFRRISEAVKQFYHLCCCCSLLAIILSQFPHVYFLLR